MTTFNGDDDDNTITGTSGDDIINAFGGDDTINAGSGADVINGGDGDDVINAGSGSDTITGGAGDDTITGGGGTDTVIINANAANGIATQTGFSLYVSTLDGLDALTGVEAIQFNNFTVTVVNGDALAHLVADTDNVNQQGTVPENAANGVLGNDVDIDDAMTVTAIKTAGNVAGTVGSPLANTYGSLTLNADGSYSYTAAAGTNTLGAGQTATDSFTYTETSGGVSNTQTLTITIHGTNDAAIISGTSTGSVTEAGGVLNGTGGTPSASGTLTDTDVDANNSANTFTASSGTSDTGFGSYSIDASGNWSFTLDNNASVTQGLQTGDTVTETFTVASQDGTTQQISITIHGTNDAAVVSGNTTGSATEAGGVSNGTAGSDATGTLSDTDVDNAANTFQAASAASTGGYGNYTLDAAGHWDYTVDDSNATVQALNVGGTLTDHFTALTADGTSQVVTITIHGANDAAVISGDITGDVTEAGGVSNGTAGSPTDTGSLSDTDVDNTADTFTVSSGTSDTGYGSYSIDASGNWSFTLNNNASITQGLQSGDTVTETFTVASADGTTQQISVTIHGANDAAVVSGNTTGSATEAGGVANGTPGTFYVTGTLTDSDVDNTANTFQSASGGSAGGYGVFSVGSDGSWSYSLSDSNATVQALNVGETLTDAFTVFTEDGTTQVVSITIHGANDAAVISGDITGGVTEAGGVSNGTAGSPTDTGQLTDTDVDNTADTFTVASGTSDTGYGSYSIDASGAWSFTLNDSASITQGLQTGQTVTETFTVHSVDGTAQQISVTINGANDAAVVSGNITGSATEAGGVANGTAGSDATGTLTDSDVDNTANTFQAASAASTGGYGNYTLDAAGHWDYTVDDSNATVQALNVGGTLTDHFTALTADGTSQVVTITIHGANDAAVISGDITGAVTEAGGIANGTAGSPSSSGQLTDTDVDNAPDTFTAASGTSDGGYGFYSIDASGNWSFTLDDNTSVTQSLHAGQTASETFTVHTVDGTAQQVSITLHGTNDAPTISASTPAVLAENGSGGGVFVLPNANASATLTRADVDSGDSATYDSAYLLSHGWSTANGGSTYTHAATYGTVTLNTGSNTLSYALSESLANSLDAGQVTTQSFTVQVIDGSNATAQTTVTFQVDGNNDRPVVTAGPQSNAIIEAGYNVGGTQTATITVTGTDPDAGESTFFDGPVMHFLSGWDTSNSFNYTHGGAYGSVSLDNFTGVVTYTLNEGAADFLAAGQTVTETFTLYKSDPHGFDDHTDITFTITGTNDAPTITSAVATPSIDDTAAADTFANTAGNLTSSDPDSAQGTFGIDTGATGSYTVDAASYGVQKVGDYGTLYINSTTGDYTYVADASAVDALKTTAHDIFTFTATDDLGAVGTQTFDVTVNGTNDTPTIAAENAGTLTDTSVNDGFSDLSGSLDGADRDTGDTANLSYAIGDGSDAGTGAEAGDYGTLNVSADGTYTYIADANAINVLHAGSYTDTFDVQTTDADGLSATSTLTVHVTGANDTPTLANESAGTETDTATNNSFTDLTGTLDGADRDSGETATLSYAIGNGSGAGSGSHAGAYGTLTVNADGTYTYVADAAAVQALKAGESDTDTFQIQTTDANGASATATLTVNIVGDNDTPTLSAENAGTLVDTATNNSFSDLTGQLDGADRDAGQTATLSYAIGDGSDAGSGSLAGDYGTLTVNADGSYSYAADAAAINALHAGSVTDTFDVQTTDADGLVATSTLTVHVTGANDTPTLANENAGTLTDTSTNNTFSDLTGALDGADRDTGESATLSYAIGDGSGAGLGSQGGSYGTLTVNTDGTYSYAANAAAINALHAGSFTDTFTVQTTDVNGASGTATLTVNITGANDTPTITAEDAGTLVDTAGNTSFADLTGSLDGSDRDTGETATLTYAGEFGGEGFSNAPTAGTYGTLTVNTDGTYSYAANAAAINALHAGSYTDTFVVKTTDVNGAAAATTLTVHITGANDTPTLAAADAGTLVDTAANDAFAATPDLSGTLVGTDRDTGETATLSYAIGNGSGAGTGSLAGTYGTLTVNANGTYSYEANATAINALTAGSYSDVFNVQTSDVNGARTTSTLTVHITGANDTPVLNATVQAATYTDTSGDDTFGNVVGTLSTTDPDTGDTATYGVTGGTTGGHTPVGGHFYDVSLVGAYGKLYVDSVTGGYVYVPTDAAIEGLKTTAHDTFSLKVTDGSSAVGTASLDITLNGANDTPTLTASVTAKTFDDTAADDTFAKFTGQLTSTDRDIADSKTFGITGGVGGGSAVFGTFTYDISAVQTYGTLYVNSTTGKYIFVPNDTTIEALKTTVTDSYTLTVTDGSNATVSQTLTLTLNGANDTPTAVNDTGSAGENETKDFAILANDSDRDHDTLTPTIQSVVTTSSNAAVNGINATADFSIVGGQLHFVPGSSFDPLNDGQTAKVVITYQISDGSGGTSTATETLTINGANEIVTGTSGDDVLTGGSIGDTINGLDGDDVINSGTGDDSVHGGNGDDLINGGAGNDTLYGDAGDDSLNGSSGNDTMIGGTGNDTYTVDSVSDVVTENADEGIDTVNSSVTRTLAANVENLNLTGAAAINGTGNELDNAIFGNSAANVLSGAAGDDVIKAGAGADTVDGGAGDDNLDGGADIDTVTYASATAGVTVSLALTGFQDTLGAGVDKLKGFENLTGSGFNDTLTGDGGDNVLTGGNGNDTLQGGAGNDTLAGGAGNDIVSYASATSGVTVNITLATAQITGGAGSDTLSGIEGIIGSAFADTLIAGSGVNTLTGGLGADTLTGGSSGDIFVYNAVAESTSTGYDTITDMRFDNLDHLDLDVSVTGVDARIVTGTLTAGSFDTDLAAAASGLGAHHAVAFTAATGGLSGNTFVIVDANGIVGYQAGQDYVFHVANGNASQVTSMDTTDFI